MTPHATRVEISIEALKHNLHQFKSILTGTTNVLAIIKSNAYGHGMEIAPLIENEVGGFGVVNINEAVYLRNLGVKSRIIVIGPTDENAAWQIAQQKNIEVCLFDDRYLDNISTSLPPLQVHIKLNTGLNRLGITNKELPFFIERLATHNIIIKGMFSHLADSENPASAQTKDQLLSFNAAIQQNKPTTDQLEKHIAATAATLLFPESHYDWVRIGIGLYGIWPSPETRESWEHLHARSNFTLVPALRYLTNIVCIQQVDAGALIGYGGTYRTRKTSRIATIPIGYYEGVPRQLSNKGHVLVGNKVAPIVGNICMNMTMIDITDAPEAAVGSEVIYIENDHNSPVSAQSQSELAGTIPYALLTNIPPHIPRQLK